MNRIVREVNGACSFEKKAAVLALATAPSIANTKSASRPAYMESTTASVRTPSIRPDRSTMAMIASLLDVAMEARCRSAVTSLSVIIGPATKGVGISSGGSTIGIDDAKIMFS